MALNTVMHWTYQGNEITNMPEDVVGFVYLITNTTNGRKYIGKKLARFKRSRPPLKGRKNKRRYKVDSDWQDYYGSSEEVKTLVEDSGRDRFERRILRLCKTLGEMSYYEAKIQFETDALLKPDKYYNAFIGCKIHRKHVLKVDNKSK